MASTIATLKLYGTRHVSGVTVGNEFILNAPNNAMTSAAAVRFLVTQMATVGFVVCIAFPFASK
jgi:hypothetical protein